MPDTDPQTRRADARSWGISHVVATVPLSERNRLSTAMRDHSRSVVWASNFWALVIESLGRSLPESDPWRSASVTIQVGDDRLLSLGGDPPDAIGAITETGVPLSGPEAFFDLDQPVFEELGSDPVFAPVKDGLLPESAALVGASAIGVKVLVPAIEAMPAAAIFDTCEGAVRWLMHRKLMYGDADGIAAWFTEQVWSAEWRATAIEAGTETTPEK